MTLSSTGPPSPAADVIRRPVWKPEFDRLAAACRAVGQPNEVWSRFDPDRGPYLQVGSVSVDLASDTNGMLRLVVHHGTQRVRYSLGLGQVEFAARLIWEHSARRTRGG